MRTLWAGQALSDAGSEVYRLGAIWLAVRIAGADAAWLPIAQSVVKAAKERICPGRTGHHPPFYPGSINPL